MKDQNNQKIVIKLTSIIVGLISIIFILIILLFFNFAQAKHIQANEKNKNSWFCGVQDSAESARVFKSHCASCHSLNKRLIGPKLRGVLDRVPSEKWFDTFVRYEQVLWDNNDPYIIKLHQADTNFTWDHNFNYSQRDIDELKAYLKQ
ncbi:MAG: c-type cytochrome [Flavobacteriales bacterium]